MITSRSEAGSALGTAGLSGLYTASGVTSFGAIGLAGNRMSGVGVGAAFGSGGSA